MAQRDFNKAESELDRYMAPLSKLAKRLSTTEGATGEEVDDMMTDYEKMLKELGPNLVRHQGCYNRPRWVHAINVTMSGRQVLSRIAGGQRNFKTWRTFVRCYSHMSIQSHSS